MAINKCPICGGKTTKDIKNGAGDHCEICGFNENGRNHESSRPEESGVDDKNCM